MRRIFQFSFWFLMVVVAAAAVAGAQELADRVAAVVDKAPVFQSDIDRALGEEIYVRKLRGEAMPADSAGLLALRDELLESLIDRRIVIAKAKKESIEVTQTEVEDGLDQWLVDLVKASGSEAAFEAELERQGVALDDLKTRYRKDIEEQLYVSKFMRKQFGAIAVAEGDLVRFFQNKYDSIPSLPEVVGVAHIIVTPRISPSKENELVGKVSNVMDRMKRGEAFDKVAREVSEDPLTRGSGGEIGAVDLADLQPDVAGVAAKLVPGQVSEPFRTGGGIEIIKLDEKTDARYRLRHIFFKFAPTAGDTAEALRLAEEIRSRLTAGEGFETLARQYSEDQSTKEKGGYIGEVELSSLDDSYQQALAGLNPGDVSQVIRTALGFQTLKLVSRTAARKPDYDEAKPWIRNLIEARKREAEFVKWLDAAKQEIYVKKM
jgi:peptidyl-prolyl cis-trans isomerase SurA